MRPLLLSAMFAAPAQGHIDVFVDDVAGWEARTESVAFPFTPENVALASEVAAPPSSNQNLGFLLTFPVGSAGLPSEMVLISTGSDSDGWIFQDRGIPAMLSPGTISGDFDDDDIRIEFAQGLTAIAFEYCQNGGGVPPGSETVTCLDATGSLLVEIDLVDDDNTRCVFYGFVSSTPIHTVLIDEANEGDDAWLETPRLGSSILCGPADLAPPFGLLDLADVNAFAGGFVAGDPVSDLNGDGLFDLGDINLFVTAFLGGCP
jgi:hypothetical protein